MANTTHIRIDKDLHRPIKIRAATEGKTVQALVSGLIWNYLKEIADHEELEARRALKAKK